MTGGCADGRDTAIPRRIPPGTVPLVAVEGAPYDCGRQYAEAVLRRPDGRRAHLDATCQCINEWPRPILGLFERCAPYLLDMIRGMAGVAGCRRTPAPPDARQGCTSFGVAGSLALDRAPISGQNKDTAFTSAELYVVLRMRMTDAPTILTLAYPGELLGYGMWTTGMSLFRNNLYAMPSETGALTLETFGLLALASGSVDAAVELARKHGIRHNGAVVVSDAQGRSAAVEWDARGVTVLPAQDGVAVHANHPDRAGAGAEAVERYPDPVELEGSHFRARRLRQLLEAERSQLTPQRALMCLADHERYPRGLCRHMIGGTTDRCTTAAVAAEPTLGRLHVTRGPACCNWPVTYTADGV